MLMALWLRMCWWLDHTFALVTLPDRAYVPIMSPSTPMTAEELLQVSIPGKRVELVRGVLVVREPAGLPHGRIMLNLARRLAEYVETNGLGQVYVGDTGFTLARGPDTVRAPDIAFLRRERVPDPEPAGFPDMAPDLAVEVLSPSNRPSEVLAKIADWLNAGTLLVPLAFVSRAPIFRHPRFEHPEMGLEE